jgi:hypothetical protein
MKVFISALAASTVFAQPDPAKTTLKAITYNGTGCNPKAVSAVFSEDGSTLNLDFTELTASSGPDINSKEAKKNCQVQGIIF